jgi:hypothetical protein
MTTTTKKATKTAEEKKICQVCGRPIKAGKGFIAHHGYKRPGWGWQTASCEGALYLPFEESCDRLREVIEMVAAYLARQEAEQQDFLTNAPETLIAYEKIGSYRDEVKKEYTKPADFDPKRYYSRMYTYEAAYADRKSKYIMTIRAVKSDLEVMRQRLAGWKPAN